LLSDGNEKELCFRGREKKVTKTNLDEYIDLTIQTRLNEFNMQMEAIKKGVFLIIPEEILFFMTWEEVDLRATGKKSIDVDLLKSITAYESCSESHDSVKKFWEVMKQMTEDERSKYLKFVWGRSRLPLNLDNLNRKHSIEYYSRRSRDSLPISHTCFFRIDLPDYSSVEILKQRLLYAINYCGDIDADRAAHEIASED
jgi:E3 ubiquitin-protein ligase HERC2